MSRCIARSGPTVVKLLKDFATPIYVFSMSNCEMITIKIIYCTVPVNPNI